MMSVFWRFNEPSSWCFGLLCMLLFQLDPLCNWYRLNSESCARMLERVQNLAGVMAGMVRYSLLLEPGTITPHLTVTLLYFSFKCINCKAGIDGLHASDKLGFCSHQKKNWWVSDEEELF